MRAAWTWEATRSALFTAVAALTMLIDALARPARALWRAVRRRMLRSQIAWERDQIATIDHHAELDPIRRRWIARQIEALEVQLIDLGGHVERRGP